MAQSNKAPKQWSLGKSETLNSFNAWKENLTYVLSLDSNFTPYISATWGKWTAATPNRGFVDDGEEVTDAAARKKKEHKVAQLNLMLGQVANFATIISRNQIVKETTSLNDVWSKIREHYGFHTTGAKFLDLVNIRLDAGERYEDLFQRLVTFVDDNLLTTTCNVRHRGATITVDEQVTPTTDNMIVLLWLERIHSSLPALVKQKYGAELRNQTLASLKSEISQAMDSLLGDLKSSEDTRIMRSNTYPNRRDNSNRQFSRSNSNRENIIREYANRQSQQTKKFCCLCHAAKRPSDTHFLSQCGFLPESDRQRMTSRVRAVGIDDDDEDAGDNYPDEYQDDTAENSLFMDNPSVQRRVITRRSPYLKCFFGHVLVSVCLDSGAESSMMSERLALQIGLRIEPASQGAVQVDESSPLVIVGEVKGVILTHGPHSFKLDALVTKTNCGDVIGGEPFLEENDIALRPSKKQIIIKGKDVVPYNSQA